MVKTPGDIIKLALKQANVLGVGQSASAEDTNDAFDLLNMMMAQWQRRRYLVYHLVETSFQATGALSYTVGPGGNFNTPRPSKLEAAYFRQVIPSAPYQVDYPLNIIRAREDYDKISLKNLNSFPAYAFLDTSYPLANLYIWPLPSSLYQIFITTMEQINSFTTLQQTINLPPEYFEALYTNLAVRLGVMWGLPPNQMLITQADVALNILEATNVQIPRLEMPRDLLTGARYNIFSDTFNGS